MLLDQVHFAAGHFAAGRGYPRPAPAPCLPGYGRLSAPPIPYPGLFIGIQLPSGSIARSFLWMNYRKGCFSSCWFLLFIPLIHQD
ncbi:MAG: hypothetical protein GX878_02070 [Firmicutes bacterium]|nr:hypothetical protein [Bacillota bacterium]